MSTDLDYFYESNLDRKNIKHFYDSLPSHLKSHFERCNRTKIIWGNVLQGYRGPPNMCNNGSGDSRSLHSSNGIQEISFCWGARKDLNSLIPVFGTIAYVTGKAVQEVQDCQKEWASLYFDSKTGECLSHDRKEAIEKLNRKQEAKSKVEKESSSFNSYDNFQRSTYYRDDYNENSRSNDYEIFDVFYVQDFAHRNGIIADQAERDAYDLNSQGDDLFEQGDYEEARSKYAEAYYKSNSTVDRGKYYDNIDKATTEIQAALLRKEGDCAFFHRRNYYTAQSRYREAYYKSQVNAHRCMCNNGLIAAENEIKAIELDMEGRNLYQRVRSYQDQSLYEDLLHQAYEKFQLACYYSKDPEKCQLYKANVDALKNHIDAVKLNCEGDNLFAKGQFNEALRKYQEAHRIADKLCVQSQVLYKINQNKAIIEVAASKLNSQGDYFFKHGIYDKAHKKYNEAYYKSQSSIQRLMYNENCKKAQTEEYARVLSFNGDDLLKQDNYTEAQNKYQEAYNKSEIITEKKFYAANRDKARAIGTRLMMFNTLWKQAWDAENDSENDRSDEARELFAKILNESRKSLEIFPGNSRLKQYKTLVTLKIEGNEVFNQGLESQIRGITLFEEAQELQKRENYKSANIIFKEARNKFLEAKVKFESGCKSDKRFVSCIEFVQERIYQVTVSIKITEQNMLTLSLRNLDVNVGDNDQPYAHSCETVKHSNYSAQI